MDAPTDRRLRSNHKPIHAPRGPNLSCKGWEQEAASRMLMNSLDDNVAERARELIACAGSARPVADWGAFQEITEALKNLKSSETLLIVSGRPAGAFETSEAAPRVIAIQQASAPEGLARIAALENAHGTLRAIRASVAAWTYIGTQGHIERAYRILSTLARKHFGGTLGGKLVVSGGMGGAGGALPIAARLCGAAFLGIDVEPGRITRRIRSGYCDYCVNSIDEALRILKNAVRQKEAVSVGLTGNFAEILPELVWRGVLPDILTDQTSIDDLLNGYIPAGLDRKQTDELRSQNPGELLSRTTTSLEQHIRAILDLRRQGAITFDSGNGLGAIARELGGNEMDFDIPDAGSAYLQPLKTGRTAVRWIALSGEAQDIYQMDDLLVHSFSDDADLCDWIRAARELRFQGLPARTTFLNQHQRAVFAERLSGIVRTGNIAAPVVVAREAEIDCRDISNLLSSRSGMQSSDLNRLLNRLLSKATGAGWAAFHLRQTAGRDSSCWASYAAVEDGTPRSRKRVRQVLTE